MKKILLMFTLIAVWIASYAQAKIAKNTISKGVTATATAKYYNVKTANPDAITTLLSRDQKDGKLIRYTVSYKDTPLGKYAEYRFVYDVSDSMYVRNMFTK